MIKDFHFKILFFIYQIVLIQSKMNASKIKASLLSGQNVLEGHPVQEFIIIWHRIC